MSKRIPSKFLKQMSRDIDPDEIFLDSKNLPGFDKHHFEGRIEKPINHTAVWGVFLSFILVTFIFLIKITNLQIVNGEDFLKKSENNRLDHKPLFAMRGVIYDRNHVPLPGNSVDNEAGRMALIASETRTNTKKMPFQHRSYIFSPGFGHTLGYVSYPKRDNRGFYYQELFVGKDGLEEYYNKILSGENGLQIVETDALGMTKEGSIVENPKNGVALTLGIDSRIQEKLHTTIRDTANNFGYMAGAGAIMDVMTGELLAMTSYPEYESATLSEGKDKKIIQGYNLDKRAVFLDRAVSGVYTPGSIIKPFMAIAGLAEGIITPEKQILSTGSISIQNPYYPNIEKYARMFGFGVPTGVDITDEKSGTIPSPAWKEKMFEDGVWRLGDTYHTVIGQYGFQTTLLQALRGIASIANDGTLVTPHFLKDPVQEFASSRIPIPSEYFQVAREGID